VCEQSEKLMLSLANAVANWRFRIAMKIGRHRQRARRHAAMKLRFARLDGEPPNHRAQGGASN
jgi:hypothetical protein